MWKLLIEDDAGKTIVVPMTRDEITIGRKEGNTIRLTERNVSRHHAKLLRNNGTVLIEDLSSYNGIKLNGDKIKGRVEVKEGDLIEIGDYHLALQAEGQHAGFEVPQDETQLGGEPAGDDYDEFAGDTQRWESPVSLDDGATVQDQAPLSFTQQAPPPSFTDEKTGQNQPAPKGAPAPITALGDPVVEPPSSTERPISTEQAAPPLADAAPPSTPEPPPQPAEPPPRAGNGLADPATPPVRSAMELGGPLNPGAPTSPMRPVDPLPSGGGQSGPTTSAGVPTTQPGLVDDDDTQAMPPSPSPTAETQLGPRFVAVTTVFAGTVFPINRPEMVIGRVEDNEMVIEHRSVSRSHAKVFRDGDICRIVDLQSANGILLNGVEVNDAVMQSGDIVELGRVQLRYVPAGEGFALSPAEIERARKADLAGDFADDVGTVSRGGSFAPQQTDNKSRVMFMGALVVIALLLGVIAFLLMDDAGDGDPTQKDPVVVKNDPPPEPVKEPEPLPTPRTVVEEVEQLIETGQYDAAINKAEANKDHPQFGAPMMGLIPKAKDAKLTDAKKRAYAALDEGDLDRARNALEDMREVRKSEGAEVEARIKELEAKQAEEAAPPEVPPEPEAVPDPDPEPTKARPSGVRKTKPKPKTVRKKKPSKTKKPPPPERKTERLPAPTAPKAEPDPAKGKQLLTDATRAFIANKCAKAENLAKQAGKADPRLKYEVFWFRGKCALKAGKNEDAKAAFKKYRSRGTVPAKKADANQELRKLGG